VEGSRAEVTFEQAREGDLRPVLERSLDTDGG